MLIGPIGGWYPHSEAYLCALWFLQIDFLSWSFSELWLFVISRMTIHYPPSRWNLSLLYSTQIVSFRFMIDSYVAKLEAPTAKSLPRWKRLHLNPSYARRRSHNVWICFWAVEPRSERRESHLECDFNVSRSVKFSYYISSICHAYPTSILPLFFTEPNLESGANIDCCKLYRENKAEYERIVRRSIREQLGLWTSIDIDSGTHLDCSKYDKTASWVLPWRLKMS